ncbi:Methenyltetrahydromethanopterin cyclohydrolase [Aquisphaera giovannonii]|uniref:Methenyltetrahydromethanopterin cyclohydrolase n=1 Tax=Aquisphaera giovannonii TaxID=406548 RepID=A0A5B9W9M4_9BACT|nr:methenyltetrahydromethanopterin cyclohydrolase [Aquisphaera giovannonii]QEH37338.1 Methenyltetrahydromethanopterin cyclohydrolase [Aquisphaera giovannonii]
MTMSVNRRALWLVEALLAHAQERRVTLHLIEGGGRYIDCGIAARGGLLAGLELARVCLGDLAAVCIVPGEFAGRAVPLVQVVTDHPVQACLASQYAGWGIQEGKYFAMGSGPMRAVRGKEPVYDAIGCREREPAVVGVLEARKAPPPAVFAQVAGECGVEQAGVTLLAAPTASLAGGVQVVARSVETALHKLHALDFPMGRIQSAFGTAPLPPVARDDISAIGRTNDAVLYGGRVILQVTGDDASLEEIGPKVPSSSSKDHGEPFAAIFARYKNDFYAVDPHLFSPAEVVFQNLDTGRTHAFGRVEPEVLAGSFWS